MVSSTAKSAILALASSHAAHALTATILADTNRDGVVDVAGNSDVSGKATWTSERGALFLPNVVDTDQRCLPFNLGVANMHTCHDAIDNVLRQAQYLAPVRTLPVADASNNAVGVINITSTAAAERVRIFFQEGTAWTFVEEDYEFTPAQLRAGLTLGVDGRDIRRPGIWDGKATIQFTITDGATTSTDFVELRMAPYLAHHPVQLAQQTFGARANRPSLEKFNEDLSLHNELAGLDQPPIFLGGWDTWVQDYFEPGYASIPGPDGPVVVRIMLASHARRSASRSIFDDIRSDEVGALNFPMVWTSDNSYYGGTYDATGNLETIPPYTHNGKTYPAGRIIMGEGDTSPLILPFLHLQELQEPIVLDTSWLHVGHVDEFIQFLPADNERGWVIMVDDPLAGVQLLRDAATAGHGNLRALSRPVFSHDPYSGVHPPCVPQSTINYELSRPNLDSTNAWAAERIEYNLNIIKQETGITDDDIFRVPGIVSRSRWTCANSPTGRVASPQASQSTEDDESIELLDIVKAAEGEGSGEALRRRQAGTKVGAHYPAAINGVILSDSYYLSPNPWGPIINGVDIFAEAITAAYAQVNFTVGFIDTWFTHHQGGGEVHCGTNVWREPDSIWW